MNEYDVLAIFILWSVLFLGLLPCAFSIGEYWESVRFWITVSLLIASFAAAYCAVFWALNRLLML